jgi:hypothetical protein
MARRTSRFTFLAKLPAALALIAAADLLFDGDHIGSWLGALALGWLAVLGLARPALRRGPALAALAVAGVLAATLAFSPSLLAWLLFWCALSIAALMPRVGRFDDAWRWAVRLAGHAASGPLAPLLDLLKLIRPRVRRGRTTLPGLAAMLALPLGMTAVFVALFASANPLIDQALGQLRIPDGWRVVLWAFVGLAVWPSLRPRRFATRIIHALPQADVTLPGASPTSLLLSLALFNAVFALQNGLDLAFLWSGAPLPAGMTLADYAHRGAYPLIVTALLAGVFVLATLKPGSASAARPAIRRLVVLWVAQNLLLVASSILRTLDYVAAYSLTGFRIAALAWMGLVGLGLVLICWRMLRGRSAAWLINANALAATLLLAVASLVDLEASAAAWNVRHAREVGGSGVALDLCYLANGSSPLLPLIALERGPLPPKFRDRLRFVRNEAMTQLAAGQADWHSWTVRGAMRLAAARSALGAHPAMPTPLATGQYRDCGGWIHNPTPDPKAALTKGAGQ